MNAVKVWQNNMSNISFAKKIKSKSHRTKHIAPRFFIFIKENIDEEKIEEEYTPTLQKLVDMSTRMLSKMH